MKFSKGCKLAIMEYIHREMGIAGNGINGPGFLPGLESTITEYNPPHFDAMVPEDFMPSKTFGELIKEAAEKGDADGEVTLPAGNTIWWKKNEAGGRTYYSDEIGGGVRVTDTCLVARNTLLATIQIEDTLKEQEK